MDSTFASDVFIDGEVDRSVVKMEGSGSESVPMHSLSNIEDDDLEVIALQREAGRQLNGSDNDVSGFVSTSFSVEDPLCEDGGPCTSLMFSSHQKLMPKNFSGEIRASKDVEIFLERPTLLLDLQETSLQGIIDAMLQKMITGADAKYISFDQARMAFFTKDSVHCLSQVIQGTEISDGGGWEETQNWLIALGELPSVQQSHVAIARLKHPVNLGRSLEETHLVVLVLAPSKIVSLTHLLPLLLTLCSLGVMPLLSIKKNGQNFRNMVQFFISTIESLISCLPTRDILSDQIDWIKINLQFRPCLHERPGLKKCIVFTWILHPIKHIANG